MDLVDMTDISTSNKNYKYLLVAIDVFSRYAFVIPLRSKSTEFVGEALKEIIYETQPYIINCDLGSEFISKNFQTLLAREGKEINYVPVHEHKKIAIVDRFVRTLRQKINMYMAQHHTTTYIDVLQQLVYNYNHAYHTGIKKVPADVTNLDPHIIKVNTEKYNKAFASESLFNVGDTVRYIINRTSFSKGTLPQWTKTVHSIISSDAHSYVLENGQTKKYYELQKVDDVQKLEKPMTGPTREQMVKERSTKRKFARSGLNEADILDTVRVHKPVKRHAIE